MLVLMAPSALLLLLFQIVPIAIGANASFRDWMLTNPKGTWVGLQHYRDVLTDNEFLGWSCPTRSASCSELSPFP